MRIGMTFDQFVELELMPLAGGRQFEVEAAEMERDEMFPLHTPSAANHLRSRGYDCRTTSLDLLVENGVVKLSKPDTWLQKDVDAAAEHFEDCQIYTPYAAMCQALGCTFADWHRALREAAERESRKYGRRVRDDDQLFDMHRRPPRDDRPSIISFTLADDIKERLERGEEV